ncbi:Rv1535 domain-containing protein [Mycobacterium sp.]|uniref:Rv1535 domain-containing protein n=1 Tax=Mycobacterium sp. TaxID=1785 RepID=UPI003C719A9A
MTRTDLPADPLISPIAALLNVPLRELYALLWRVGVLEVREPAPRRPAGVLVCPDPAVHVSVRRSHQSRSYRQAAG